jgi:hypothetical protein
MTILKEGAGGIWHIYDKDTGKGKRIVVRTSHSIQRSPTLKAWQAYFAEQAHAGRITTEAKRRCMEEADKSGAPERYYSDVKAKRCKMSVLRLFMRDVLKEVAKRRPAKARRSRAAATAGATTGAAGGAAATGGAAGATSEIGGEVEGIEF